MSQLPAAALKARAGLIAGIEPDVDALRGLRGWRRAVEVATFFAIFLVGAALGIAGLRDDRFLHQMAGVALCAVALNAFMLLTHEGHHRLLARGRRANHALTLAFALPLLHSPTAYRVLHVAHHSHLGEEGDPDDYENYVESPRALWAMHWMRLTIGPFFYILAIPASAWRHARSDDRRRIVLEYAILAIVYSALYLLLSWPILLQVWLVPLIPVGFFTAVRGLAQHGLADRADPILSTRTFRAGPIVRFCLLHENYHLEHHLFPDVPSYHLGKLHALLWPRLPQVVVGHSYLGFLASFVIRSTRGDRSPLGVTDAGGAA